MYLSITIRAMTGLVGKMHERTRETQPIAPEQYGRKFEKLNKGKLLVAIITMNKLVEKNA